MSQKLFQTSNHLMTCSKYQVDLIHEAYTNNTVLLEDLNLNWNKSGHLNYRFKRYFDYEREIPDCGIQNVHFGGTLEDWQKILKKLKDLAIYDINNVLKIYIEKVSYIL